MTEPSPRPIPPDPGDPAPFPLHLVPAPDAAGENGPDLSELLIRLEGIAVAEEPDRTVVFGVAHAGAGRVSLAMKASELHPVEWLLGYRAPAEWHTVAIVANGTDIINKRRLRVSYAVTRAGQALSRVTEPTSGEVIIEDDEGYGRVTDTMARMLGVPTPPPCTPVADILHRLWLHRLLEVAAAAPDAPLAWTDAVALHPAHSPGVGRTPGAVRAATRRLTARLSWTELRHGAAGGFLSPGEHLASWFDDGSFSRWLLDDMPPPWLLLDDLACLLAPDVTRRIRRTVEGPEPAEAK
jgi:hypothetical protein